MYHLYVYVPESHLESVKTAMFKAGAGKIGNYDSCCWQTQGQGQYRPLAGSNPYQGTQNQIQQEKEYKVELVCQDNLIQHVVAAIIAAHPYEEPAFGYWKINE